MSNKIVEYHSFHIPVMGIGFTIDTPIKVAHYGINSVISLVDDSLIERMRMLYCKKYDLPYSPISNNHFDRRAERIKSYLNLVHRIVKDNIKNYKNKIINDINELNNYMNMFPDYSKFKMRFLELKEKYGNANVLKWVVDNMPIGSIDVNIMTKLDKENYFNGEKLGIEYNDAHSALRGYANSDLSSSVIFSAGMNPSLYCYLEQFKDFYPTDSGFIKKKIILKVSDYRSAIIQGKFLAKKGLWVSEFRIESGVNCGGHVFGVEGKMVGTILEEFKLKRKNLKEEIYNIFINSIRLKNYEEPSIDNLIQKITYQGGVGTSAEHEFLLDYYNLDSIGWGSPFLLVPEVTNVDKSTIELLKKSDDNDVYISDISPLGVMFSNLKNNTMELEKGKRIKKDSPGSSCPKRYLALNKEFDDLGLCLASSNYQRNKIEKIDKEELLSEDEYIYRYGKIVEKSCLCVGLANSALIVNNLDEKPTDRDVSICPGPNIVYFSNIMTLVEILSHIYGKINVISKERSSLFINELRIYIKLIQSKKERLLIDNKSEIDNITKSIKEGIEYYKNLVEELEDKFEDIKQSILLDISNLETEFLNL